MKGATMTAVQELLGQSSIVMTMRYAHRDPEAVRETFVSWMALDVRARARGILSCGLEGRTRLSCSRPGTCTTEAAMHHASRPSVSSGA